MSQNEPSQFSNNEAQLEQLTYRKIDVSELSSAPEAFKNTRVTLSGIISGIEESKTGCLIHLEISVSNGSGLETREVAVQFDEGFSAAQIGHKVTIRGVGDGSHIKVYPNFCGITVIPLLKAESVSAS